METFIYFAWISFTVTICLIWSLHRSHKRNFPQDLFFQTTGWLLIVLPLGARLLHVLYEEPAYYKEDPWRLIEIWNGGFVYYGGLIAGLIFFILFFLIERSRSFWQTADFFAPIAALGTGLGRIACFLQGCCYGQEFHGFWAIKNRHPTQLYLFFWEILLVFIILLLEKRKLPAGSRFLVWLFLSALGRFVVEFYRDDFRGRLIWGFSVSQVIALAILAVSALGGIYIFREKK